MGHELKRTCQSIRAASPHIKRYTTVGVVRESPEQRNRMNLPEMSGFVTLIVYRDILSRGKFVIRIAAPSYLCNGVIRVMTGEESCLAVSCGR